MPPHLREGGRRAVFAGLDRAVHQSPMSGPRPLAACRRCASRPLQQLRRAASQRSAPAGPSLPDAAAFAGKLSPGRSAALTGSPAGPLAPGSPGFRARGAASRTTIRDRSEDTVCGAWIRSDGVHRFRSFLRQPLAKKKERPLGGRPLEGEGH